MGASLAAESAPAARRELTTRVLSAALLAPVALAVTVIGGLPFAAFVAVIAALAFWEWTAVTDATEPGWARITGLLLLLAGLVAVEWGNADLGIGLIALPAFVALVAGYRSEAFLWTGFGLVYVAAPCAGLIVLRQAEPFGWTAILFILVVVWATDVAAYFGGRRFGGPKLWVGVSPKKTWSGALSGLAAAVIAGGLVAAVTGAGSLAMGLALAAALSVAAQAGDLIESAIKRRFGVKDSGHIIPGHGGVLDRVDGLFGAAVTAWLIAGLGLGGRILALPADVAIASGAAA